MALSLADELASAFEADPGLEVHAEADVWGSSPAIEYGLNPDPFEEIETLRDVSEATKPWQQGQGRQDRCSQAQASQPLGPAPISEPTTRSPSRAGRTNGSEKRPQQLPRAPNGPLVEDAPEVDPLASLVEIVRANGPFLSMLEYIDQAAVSSTRPNSLAVEDLLQRHLDRLHHSDRVREEQSWQMSILLREMGNIRWDTAAMEIELGLAAGDGLGLAMVDDCEDEGNEDIGWTGEPKIAKDGTLCTRAAIPDQQIELLSPDFREAVASSTPLSPVPSFYLEESWRALPRTTSSFAKSTYDLLSTLSSLRDTLHSTTSLSTASSRQLRGIRAGVDSWRDRERAEQHAWNQVEEYERRRLENGLKGSGTGLDIRGTLEQEMENFEQVLEASRHRYTDLMTAYRATTAIMA